MNMNNKRLSIAIVILGALAMLAVWILVAVLFIVPQYKIARDAGLESVAETVELLVYFASLCVGYACTRFCIKAIDDINEWED